MEKLRELANIEKQINEKFINMVLQNQGVETNLTKLYKPITTSQEATKKVIEESGKKTIEAITDQKNLEGEILTKIHETPLVSEIIDVVKAYPDIVATIIDPSQAPNLTGHELSIYNKAAELPKKKLELVRDFLLLQAQRQAEVDAQVEVEVAPFGSAAYEHAISKASSSETTANIFGIINRPTDLSKNLYIGNYSLQSNADNAIITDFSTIEGNDAELVWELLTRKKIDAERYSDKQIDDYLHLLEHGNVKIRSNTSKAKILGEYVTNSQIHPDAVVKNQYARYLDIYQKTLSPMKKGEGISTTEDLQHELVRLVGGYKAGNTSVYNEINNVVDKLRRSGVISIEDSKKIYKSLK